MTLSKPIKKFCIVMPTYNEAKNIKKTLTAVFKEAKKAKRDKHIHVLVVDDSSPDGTAKIVKQMRKTNKRIHLFERKEKNGLGAAYIAGMQHAIKKLNPDLLIEMDADGQHNPKDVPRLVTAIEEGADFAIGSRYVTGGSVPEVWGWQRKLVSKCAVFATTTLLGMRGVKDCAGGFRAIRTDIVKKINFDGLGVKGYAFQAVFLEACMHEGAVVKEIPIDFLDRSEGESKMSIKDILEGFSIFAKVRSKRLFRQKRRPTGVHVPN